MEFQHRRKLTWIMANMLQKLSIQEWIILLLSDDNNGVVQQ